MNDRQASGGTGAETVRPGALEIQALRQVLAPEYAYFTDEQLAELLAQSLEGLSPAEVENFLNALKSVNWGSVLTGAMGGAATGATVGSAFPGYGTLIGGALGALAGGVAGGIGGAPPPAPTPAPATSPPPTRPRAPAGGPPAPIPPPPPGASAPFTPPPPPAAGTPLGGGDAGGTLGQIAAAIVAAIQNPQVMNAIASALMGVAGRREVYAAGRAVPRAAIFEMLQVLAELATQQAERLDGPVAGWPAEGIDTASPEARAIATLELIRAAGAAVQRPVESRAPGVAAESTTAPARQVWTPAQGAPWVRITREDIDDSETSATRLAEEAAERIVRKLNNDLAALPRFKSPVADTTVFPYSAICQLRIEMSSGTRGIGTGFYIAPTVILTAGHNVLHERYGRATRMVIRPGRNGGREPFGRFEITPAQMTIHPNWASNMGSADHDLAVLRVPVRAPNGHYFALDELRFNPASGVVVCGYAADVSVGLDPDAQHSDYDTIRNLSNGAFDYSLHTTGGTSGSPVFYVDGRRIVAVGVHSRGFDETTNRGCRLTDAKIRWISSASRTELVAAESLLAGVGGAGAGAGWGDGLTYLESLGAFGAAAPGNGRRW